MSLRRASSFLGVVVAAAPLAVSSPDSSITTLRVAGGRGAYAIVTRGCNGEILSADKVPLENAAVDLSHKFRAPVRVGARAGIVRLPNRLPLVRYVNPYVAVEGPGFSVGSGWLHADRQLPEADDQGIDGEPFNSFSGHLRTGKKGYWSVSYFEGLPITTGGYLQTGFGWDEGDFHIWGGTGLKPQDRPGLVASMDLRIVGGLSVGASGRLGSSGGVSESGFALALSYAWVHRSRETSAARSVRAPGFEVPDSLAAPPESLTAPVLAPD
jgi:hypothetical protein